MTIPDELLAEVGADVRAGGQRAVRWQPPGRDGSPVLVIFSAPLSPPDDLVATLSHDAGGLAALQVADDDGEVRQSLGARSKWIKGCAWALIGSADDPDSPRPGRGDRVLVLETLGGEWKTDWIGRPDRTTTTGPVPVINPAHDKERSLPPPCIATEWAVLPAAWSGSATPDFTEPDEWPDPALRERVARALSWHSDGQHRDDYQYFRGYWLGAADMALKESGLAEVTAERDRARDVAVALERESAEADSHSRCRHHDGTCSGIVEANEALGEEVGRLRAALEAVLRVDPGFDDAIDEAFSVARAGLDG